MSKSNALFLKRSQQARKAWRTRRRPQHKAMRAERGSKAALAAWCKLNGWRVVFFEGRTGAPRTGIVDALLVRIASGDADCLELRLVQLKSGGSGLTAAEVARLKNAVNKVRKDWELGAFDGTVLHWMRASQIDKGV